MGIEDVICGIISVLMVMMTVTMHYEIKRFIWNILPRLKRWPCLMMNFIILTLMAGHTISIWMYGITYWVLDKYLGIHGLGGQHEDGFISYIYFSAATYSSLGLGDIYPLGALRMLMTVEVINGLLMIGLSVTLTYFVMERFWRMHNPRSTNEDASPTNDSL